MLLLSALILAIFIFGCTEKQQTQTFLQREAGKPQAQLPEAPTAEVAKTPVPEQKLQVTQPQQAFKEFRVVIGHTSYKPDSFTVKRGDRIKLLATVASGTAGHNHGVTIDEFNVNEAVTTEDNPKAIEFTADKAGTFSIWCKTCWDGPFGKGHPDIRAKLVVEA